jgi:hypothetical protein
MRQSLRMLVSWNSFVRLLMFDDKVTGIKKGLMAVFGI